MDPVIAFVAAAVIGSFLGTLLFSRLGHWFLSIQSAIAAARNEGAPKATVLFVALFSSGPWLLAVVILAGYYILSSEHTAFWNWFFGAAAVAIAGWLLFSMSLHLRAKRATPAATTSPNKRFQYPVYIRTKRNFLLSWTGLACVLAPVFVWVSGRSGTPWDLSIIIAIVLIPFSTLTGLFIWQIIGPAVSTGTRFITRTEPTPPPEPVDGEAGREKAR